MTASSHDRVAAIDAIKAVASQLIVLHHLSFYGPLTDQAWPLAPAFFDWMADQARLAVQVFLVIGGYLAARTIAPAGGLLPHRSVIALIARRYVRLAVPCVAAIGLAIVAAALARRGMHQDWIPSAPTGSQLLANVLMLQDVLGYDALSAGLWYVAIDLQLYALLAVLLWIGRGHGMTLVAAIGIASIWAFNRNTALDAWAVYFFGAYALGAFAWWAGRGACRPFLPVLLGVVTVVALAVDFRIRIALALAVSSLLLAFNQMHVPSRWLAVRPVAWLGRIAYSVFLVHFPVCMVVSAFWTEYLPDDPWTSLAGVIVAVGASIGVGALFHHYVECRADALVSRGIARVASLRRAAAGAE